MKKTTEKELATARVIPIRKKKNNQESENFDTIPDGHPEDASRSTPDSHQQSGGDANSLGAEAALWTKGDVPDERVTSSDWMSSPADTLLAQASSGTTAGTDSMAERATPATGASTAIAPVGAVAAAAPAASIMMAGIGLAALASGGSSDKNDAVVKDVTPPTAVISSNVQGEATAEVRYTITFNEVVKGFSAANITTNVGTLSGFAAENDGKTFTILWTPPGNDSGKVQLSINAHGVTDEAGQEMTPVTAYEQSFVTLQPISVKGALTAGRAVAGLTVEALDGNGEVIDRTLTDSDGNYTLNIQAVYRGQNLMLRAYDSSADGSGYTDEATGESKDFSISLRAMLVLDANPNLTQVAQITVATELAARILVGEGNQLSGKSDREINQANKVVANFLGLGEGADLVKTTAPEVVGQGDGNTSDAYGKGLALLSGMDAVVERNGASNPTDAVLAQLAQAFTPVNGDLQAKFDDAELLNLLSQAVTEVAQTQGGNSSLAQNLADIALAAITSTDVSNAPLAFFMTSNHNLIGDGKTTTINFVFDMAPTTEQITALRSALNVTGGTLGNLARDDSNASGKIYTASFTQSGADAPLIAARGAGYFANDLSMGFDYVAPTLTVTRVQGLDSSGQATTVLKTGDTLRVTVSANEAVNVLEGTVVKLNVGGQSVDATYKSSLSGTRTLVFEAIVQTGHNDAQGVGILGMAGTIQDRAENAADLTALVGYSGLPVFVDTAAPTVLAQIPMDNSTVGNASVASITLSFGEAMRLGGSGELTLKNAQGEAVASWTANAGTLSANERSVSYALPNSLSTLPAGQYTLEATGSPLLDKAGNALNANALSSDGSWSFTVGAVSIVIDHIGGDNLLNASDLKSAIGITGRVDGAGSQDLSASNIQVQLTPLGGGEVVQVTVGSLSNGQWTASVPASVAATLQGAYVVQVSVESEAVQASASSVFLADTQVQMNLGQVSGDNLISLLEQNIINTGKTLAYSFVAEKGANGSITFQNNADASKTVSKLFTHAKGTAADQVLLTKADLAVLGTGDFTVSAQVTDGAGNTQTQSRAFSIEAAPTVAQISTIVLQGSRNGQQMLGDTLLATVTFDKAVTVSDGSSLQLSLQVGDNARQASLMGTSADRKQLVFAYTVTTQDLDANGVSLPANALALNGAMIKDVVLGTAAKLTTAAVADVSALTVDGRITEAPADLLLQVSEAGLTAAHVPTVGIATANGKLLAATQISRGVTLEKVQFGSDSEIAVTEAGATVQGRYGNWTVQSNGSYSYTLLNNSSATQQLKAGDTATDVLSFWTAGSSVPGTASVNVQGRNDAPTVSGGLIVRKNEGEASFGINLLENASDVDAGDSLSVSGITYKIGNGAVSATVPPGLSLNGQTLTLDPGHVAFDSMAAGATQTIVVNYVVRDVMGASVRHSATLTVVGSNDGPTVAAALMQTVAEDSGTIRMNLLEGASDRDSGDTLSLGTITYAIDGVATADGGQAVPTGVMVDTHGVLQLNTNHSTFDNLLSGESRIITAQYSIQDAQGASVQQSASITLTGETIAPTASTVASEAPRAYDLGALSGVSADSFLVRFSETVNTDLLQAAIAQGKISLKGANDEVHLLGTGAVFEAYTPSQIVVSGLSESANGSYTSLWNSATNSNSTVPSFANGFGLTHPNSFSVNNGTSIYQKTNADGSVWYIWQQTGWRTWIVSQDSPVDTQGHAKEWFISSTVNNTDPILRTAVLGASAWSAKSGALKDGDDPWAGTSRIAAADLEPNGWGRTYLLALGAGNTAQAGDTLVIDKSFVKDTSHNFASADVGFVLPTDITRPTLSGSVLATVQGIGSDGAVKASPLVVGDVVRVTVTMAEAVTVSTNASPSVTLELDAGTRQASINRELSFANGASSSTALVFDYSVKEGDSDALGGISVGAYNRNNSNSYDLAGNRMTAPSDIVESINSVSLVADSTAPSLQSSYNSDKAIISGATGDTLNFKFNELVNVDNLEAAFANGKVRVVSANGNTVRQLGAGSRFEATYPSTIEVAGFNEAADGTYVTLWSPTYNKNIGAPSFSGFSTNGTALSADVTSPVYQHTDPAGQDWYLWRPTGFSIYVLSPASSVIGNLAQDWWAAGNGAGMGTDANPREGVLLAGDWYANTGNLSGSQSALQTNNKISNQPTLEATGWAITFTLALGNGHDVQQGDKIVLDAGAASDVRGNSNGAPVSFDLHTDTIRPVLGQAVVKAYKNNGGTSSQSSTYTETTDALGQYDLIRVEIPVSETLRLYHSGGSTGSVALTIGEQTRYAYLNLQLSSSTGSTAWGFTSNKLIYEYSIQADDNDTQGGITVGALNRGSVGMYDVANNRPWLPSDVPEEANTIKVVDTKGPVFSLSYASGSTAVLTANESLDANNLPPVSAFSVTVNGKFVTVKSLAVTNHNIVVLTLASPMDSGAGVQVYYTDPTSSNDAKAIQDLAGNDASSMISQLVMASYVPTVQYNAATINKIELAGDSELRFTLKFSGVVAISGTPRLVLTVDDGQTHQTVYANYEAYADAPNGQTSVEFVYRPAAGVQGQVHVSSYDAHGGSITAYESQGTVPVTITVDDSTVFSPYPWIYAQGLDSTTGNGANNLLTPWSDNPDNTPRSLSANSASGGAGNRDVLVLSVLLPTSVTSSSAANAYHLSYNVTDQGVRQVLLKNGNDTVDTYTVPSDAEWPAGVEQLLYHAVYKDSAGKVQFADVSNVLLTLGQHEYIDPVNANQRWLQGSLNGEKIDMTGRDAAQFIFIEGEQGNDTLIGHDGTDIIRGGDGNNLIKAGRGSDQVVIRQGSDTIDGGDDADYLRFDLAGDDKKITLDATGVIHVYSANGSWSNGFKPDANGWVERYRLSTDFGTEGSNRIAVYDVALGRRVAIAANMESLQWRLDDNSAGRTNNTFKVGTSGADTLSEADVVLAGAGNDTILLNGRWLHANDWRISNRALLIDGGEGRDTLQLSTYVNGKFSQVFEWNTADNINASRVLKNIEGLQLDAGGYIEMSSQDIRNLYATGSNANAWGDVITGLDASKQQFMVTGTTGTLALSDLSGWTAKTATVAGNGQTFRIYEHSDVQLLVATSVGVSGVGIVNEGSTPVSTGPAPVVRLVRADLPIFGTPGDTLHFAVELDQQVSVQGTPRLALTLFDPTGVQASRTVYADFVPDDNMPQQSTLEFAYAYGSNDAVGPGWMYRISGLENTSGSSIKSVETASFNQNANLALNAVANTAGAWLYTSFTGSTGTAQNDMMSVWDVANESVAHTLSTSTANGGTGDRDVMGVPVLLPSSVTTAEQARNYYLSYEVSTDSSGVATGRYVRLYQSGNATALDTYNLPLDPSKWPTAVEALGYFLQFKDADHQIHETDHPGDTQVFWKTTQSATDSVTGDFAYHGSYRNDTVDLQLIAATQRVLVRGNQGNDTITGHDGTDVINGDGGHDLINAGLGNDVVYLSSGVDTLVGGAGTDTLAWYVSGQESLPEFSADGKLLVKSALGSWTSNGFVPDDKGYQLDWTFDFNGQTGAILAQRAGSNETSTATGFEKMRIYHDLYQTVQGESTNMFDILLGSSGNDVLSTTFSQGLLHGLDGDDTIRLASANLPALMGGNGNDVFELSQIATTGTETVWMHGGSGTDVIKLGTDIQGTHVTRSSQDVIRSIEVFDITGSTVSGAVGNSVTMSVQWLRELTDEASVRSFTIQGDANDQVNLQKADNWQQQTTSDRSGYVLYQTSYTGETLSLYLDSNLGKINTVL